MIDVAVATSVPLPSFAKQNSRLLQALTRKNLTSEVRAWRDEAQPQAYSAPGRLTLLWSISEEDARSQAFQSWAERASVESRLVNPLTAVRRERDKAYLNELDQAGVPTVPSLWFQSASLSLEYLVARVDWKAFVLRSAAGGELLHFEREQLAPAQEHLDRIEGEAILQPYLSQAEQEGILAMHFVRGEFSHATRLFPLEGEWRTHEFGSRLERGEFQGTQLEIAQAAMRALAPECTFARVDLVRDIDGPPSVMQLRSAGPRMGIELVEGAADRLVEALSELLQ